MSFWKSTWSNVLASVITAVLLPLLPTFLASIGLPAGGDFVLGLSRGFWRYLTSEVAVPRYGLFALAGLAGVLLGPVVKSAYNKWRVQVENPEDRERKILDLEKKLEEELTESGPPGMRPIYPYEVTELEKKILMLLALSDFGAPSAEEVQRITKSSRIITRHAIQNLISREHVGVIKVDDKVHLQLTPAGVDFAVRNGIAR